MDFFLKKKKSFWLVKNTKYVKLRKEKKEKKKKKGMTLRQKIENNTIFD
jgi:hypothetical protein